MRARSLWYVGPRRLEIREIELPEPGPGQVLIKVDVCGVCAWDLFIFSGGFQEHREFPFYFGHEGIGRVVRCGPGADLAEGQRVALRESAEIGRIGGGHMAECSIQTADRLIILPDDDVPDHLFMVEPTACCVNAMNITPVRAGDRVALVGAGYMGGILLQLLTMAPAVQVVVFERRPESLAYSRKIAGRPGGPEVRVLDTREDPPGGSWLEAEGPFDVVVETTGVEPGFRLADSLVRSGGRFVIFSWQHRPFQMDFGSWHVRGLTVHNSSPAESRDMTGCFTQAGALLHANRIDQTPLVTHVARPEDAAELYEKGLAKTDGYIKGVIRWS